MMTAIVTSRVLKNEATGLDIAVPSFKETTGFLSSTAEYHVVVITRLGCFKSAKHKESDLVQFMLTKSFSELEYLHKALSSSFPGTLLPPFPKKGLTDNTQTIQEKQIALDKIMKFVSATPKLALAPDTLAFLGLSRMKAINFEEQIRSGKIPSQVKGQTNSNELESEEKTENIFADDNEEDDEEGGIFSNKVSSSRSIEKDSTKLFEDQDYGGAIDGENEDLFLIPGARKNTSEEETSKFTEENSDLLNIDDDLEDVLRISNAPVTSSGKPLLKPKPGVSTKPQISDKPVLPAKPTLPPKPRKSTQAKETVSNVNADDMGSEDILKYIQEAGDSDSDGGLFS